MKDIVERNLKELNELYDYYLEKWDDLQDEDKYLEERLIEIRSKIGVLESLMEEYYESKNNNK